MVNVYLIYDNTKYNCKSVYEDLVSEQSLQALKDLEPCINYIPYAVNGSDHFSEAISNIRQENPHAKIAVLMKLSTPRLEKVPQAVREDSKKGLVDFFIFTHHARTFQKIEQPEWAPYIMQITHWDGGLHDGDGEPLLKRIIGQAHKSVFKKLLEGSQPSSKFVTNHEPKPTSNPKSQKTEPDEPVTSESVTPRPQSKNSTLYVSPTDTAGIAKEKQKQAEREAMLKDGDADDQFQEGKHAMSKLMDLLEAYKKASSSLYAQSFYNDMRERLAPKPGQLSNEARFKSFYSYFFEKTNNPEMTNIAYMKKMDKSRSMLRLLAGIAAVLVTIATFPIGIPVVAVIHDITDRNPLDLFNTHVEQFEKDINILRKGKSMRFLDQASPKPDAGQEPENTSKNKPS